MTQRSGPVPVIGAGLAGLTAALSLARFGFAVEVFERAGVLEEAGAGIQLSPNALRVLDRLGLLPDLAAAGVEARAVLLRNGRTGREIARVPVEAADGYPYLSIHRADLQRALLAAVATTPSIQLRLGATLTGCDLSDGVAHLRFEHAADAGAVLVREAAIVVGADGVRSALARSLGLPAPVPSGMTAWRMSAAADAGDGAPAGIEAWLGPRRHAVAYPVRGGRIVNLVLIGRGPASGPAADPDAAKARLLRDFGGWDAGLLRWVEAARRPTGWPLMSVRADRPPVHGGCACLIGDAAHAMLPYAAQGAAMAIEDGYMLAHRLAGAASPASALGRYAAERAPRLARVRARVGFHRLVYHLPPPFSLARDAVLAMRSGPSLRDDLGWLYDWRPPAA